MTPISKIYEPLTTIILKNSSNDYVTGLTPGDANIRITIRRGDSSSVTVVGGSDIESIATIGTYASPSASTKVRFGEINLTNLAGAYELQFHTSVAAFGVGNYFHYRVSDITVPARFSPVDGACQVIQSADVQSIGTDENAAFTLGLALTDYDGSGGFKATDTDGVAIPAKVDALFDVNVNELTAVPAANVGIKSMLKFIFMSLRNRMTQTATTKTLYRDDSTTTVGSSTVSDDGTTFDAGKLT